MKPIIGSCVFLALAGHVPAGEIRLDECPAPVQETVRQYGRQGKVDEAKSYDIQGRMLYVVEIDLPDKRELRLHVSPDGTLVKMSEEITADELPEAVRAVVDGKAAGGTLDDVERETVGKVVRYRIEIERKRMPDVDLLLDPSGAVLSEKEEADD
ncbi:hypothetical protein JIN84_12505 [Luteolibacter yonseiensis]|uniref:PepSY domain-containing protein n=1 Tax=Luteolibacter yonseiensis TaxID=1144680 RepID=A0A934VBT1_9BACT|nr:hypothetical protein [Luteolibacter yonseiensis]MBK1816440.1 hypothetical protein [Luteolibacter yonseiensis]